MASIFKNPSHVAQIGYNGFNMSQTLDFTCAPCMLLPAYYDILNPGDKFRGNCRVKLRTQPLEAAAEFEATIRCDWFAVPIEQLFKFFGDQYYGIQDIGTDLIQVGRSYSFQASSNMPYFSLASYGTALEGAYVGAVTGGSLVFPLNFFHYELSTLNQMTKMQQICFLNDQMRLLDFLGYPISQVDTFSMQMSSFPVTALAYQKIFYDYYRDSERQSNDPSAYNVDSHLDNTNRVITAQQCLNDIFRLHYIPWKKDFFKNVFESPLQGYQSVGSLGSDVGLVNQWLTGLNKVSTGVTNSLASQTPRGGALSPDAVTPTSVMIPSQNQNGANFNPLNVISVFNPANMKAMFAVQKALEITRRSGKHYDMQTLAHWGVSVPEGISGEVIYLGSQTQPLIVGDVISTAESGNQPLGTIAGKGYSGVNVEGSYNPQISFEAKSHCVIMCIFCVQPELRYAQEGLDKLNMLVSPADWLHPEYDNLGMQPMFKYQMYLNTSDASDVYKWQYSYSELKCKYNRVLGNVSAYSALSSWVPQVVYGSTNGDLFYRSGLLYDFLGTPAWLNRSLSYKYMYEYLVDPADTAAGFIDGYYQSLYVRDPFIVSAAFDCSKASKMSKYGLMDL